MEAVQENILEGITLTERAVKQIKQIKTDVDGDYLRASITKGGCSGLNYGLAWDNNIHQFDSVFEQYGIKLVVDFNSLLYLKGMEIDYSSDLLSGGFTFSNPNAQRTCGCGTSFSV